MDVIDDYNLSVSKPDGKTSTVSIYDVRSVADEEKVKNKKKPQSGNGKGDSPKIAL